MLIVLPILFFVYLWRWLSLRIAWREAFLWVAVVWGILVTGSTELLSLAGVLTPSGLIIFWLFVLLLLVWACRPESRLLALPRWPMLTRLAWVFLACILVIFIPTGLAAIISPPNYSDGLSYHLPRVMHWLQTQSVAFYPTSIDRQLHHNPWSEYAILHLMALAGGDWPAQLVQWFAGLGCLVAISLLAGLFGADQRGQWLAALLAASMPSFIMQITSTMTDVTTGFWVLCFVFFSLQWMKHPGWLMALGLGIALGLAVLTKATTYLYAFPFVLWLGTDWIRRRNLAELAQLAVAAGLVLTLTAGHHLRNYDLYGSPLGPIYAPGESPYQNAFFSVPGVASNLIRNLALHIGLPGGWPVTQWMQAGIQQFHEQVLGISMNEPGLNFLSTKFMIHPLTRIEDRAGNLLHLLLFFAGAILFLLKTPWRSPQMIYFGVCLLAGLAFSAYLRWQPWHTRLHTPIFLVCIPWLAWLLDRHFFPRWGNVLAISLVLLSLPWVFYGRSKPFWGSGNIFTTPRESLYLIDRPEADDYIAGMDVLGASGCNTIGLVAHVNAMEYPAWVFLQDRLGEVLVIKHILVTDESSRQGDSYWQGFEPCAVLSLYLDTPETITFKEQAYHLARQGQWVGVYLP